MFAATVEVAQPSRETPGWDEISPAEYPIQSFSGTMSWGSEPGEFSLVYTSDNPIELGAAVSVGIGQYFFAGICESCVPVVSSQGNASQLTFKDYRKWLAWDKAYCLFNHVEDILVNGYRKRRYWHIIPDNFNTGLRTYTDVPYNADEIMQLVLAHSSMETAWTVGYLNTSGTLVDSTYHPNLGYPVYEVDCMQGKPVSVLFTELCEQCGLMFTHWPTDANLFRIVFAQRGVDGPTVTVPTNSDNQQSGNELSGNPTRVRVLGNRNLYQIHDIALTYDWNTNWNTFYDLNIFVKYIFENYGTFGLSWGGAGTDPDYLILHQESLALALRITVRQFDVYMGDAGTYLDWRKYGGKCRNDLPAALYISNVLYRCFRIPAGWSFTNTYGVSVGVSNVEVQDRLLTAVTHNPTTGATAVDLDYPTNSNAYVVAQGYQVGKDMFESIRPEQFDLTKWTDACSIWQKVECRVEDPGDYTGPLIIFDEAVINSADLVTTVDGYAVFAAAPTITVPSIKATLCFAAEPFSWFQTEINEDPETPGEDPVMGTQTHDEVLNVGGLNGEFVKYYNDIGVLTTAEVPYVDGQYCRTKAIIYANNFLKFQWTHARGQFTEPIAVGTARTLHGKIDRLVIEYSPEGATATVSLTNEIQRQNYVPERDLMRMNQLAAELPAQAELRKQSEYARKIAAALRSSKDAYKMLTDAFKGNFMEAKEAKMTLVDPSSGGTIPIGSVFVKEPNTPVAGVITKTTPAYLPECSIAFTEFAGVTTRHNEGLNATVPNNIPLQRNGYALARVCGPVSANDPVGVELNGDTTDYAALTGVNYDVYAGTVLQDVAEGECKLVRVLLGGGGGPTVELEVCDPDDGTTQTYVIYGYPKA